MSEEHDEDPDHGWTVGTDIWTRFSHAEQALKQAAGIKDEIAVPGSMFAAYVKDAQDRATVAMIALVTVDPRDSYEILRLQKEIAGYADVTHWISAAMDQGAEAQGEYDEIIAAEQRVEGED